jgi:quinol monooxygenase YgiN
MTAKLYARMSVWKIKPGMRPEAVKIVEESLEEIRKNKGFRGLITLLPSDDPNGATFMAIWDSEEALKASEKGVYQKVSGKAMSLAEKPPEVKHFEIPNALLALI